MADLKFNNEYIPGNAETLVPDSPAPQVNRRYFWGLTGEAEIYGGTAGRILRVRHWLEPPRGRADGQGYKELQEEITRLELLIGVFGKLEQGVVFSNRVLWGIYDDCRFVSATPLALPGQDAAEPSIKVSVDGYAWVQLFQLEFYQLNPRAQQ